jgi:hypothetical protein
MSSPRTGSTGPSRRGSAEVVVVVVGGPGPGARRAVILVHTLTGFPVFTERVQAAGWNHLRGDSVRNGRTSAGGRNVFGRFRRVRPKFSGTATATATNGNVTLCSSTGKPGFRGCRFCVHYYCRWQRVLVLCTGGLPVHTCGHQTEHRLHT